MQRGLRQAPPTSVISLGFGGTAIVLVYAVNAFQVTTLVLSANLTRKHDKAAPHVANSREVAKARNNTLLSGRLQRV
jgi:hypothetical protein